MGHQQLELGGASGVTLTWDVMVRHGRPGSDAPSVEQAGSFAGIHFPLGTIVCMGQHGEMEPLERAVALLVDTGLVVGSTGYFHGSGDGEMAGLAGRRRAPIGSVECVSPPGPPADILGSLRYAGTSAVTERAGCWGNGRSARTAPGKGPIETRPDTAKRGCRAISRAAAQTLALAVSEDPSKLSTYTKTRHRIHRDDEPVP